MVSKHPLRHNLKPAMLVMVVPFSIGAFVVWYVLSGMYGRALAEAGNERLVTMGWPAAVQAFQRHAPDYSRKFAYYQVKDGQTLATLADWFGVDQAKLASLNPGLVVPGTTIMVPPVDHPLAAAPGPNGVLTSANVAVDQGMLHIKQSFRNPKATTTIPDLMRLLSPWNAIQQIGPATYRITRPISVEDNIQLDVTGATVKKLELQSGHLAAACLCSSRSEVLIKDTDITSYDPSAHGPDTNAGDGRAFVRNINGRQDIIGSRLEYLGTGLPKATTGIDPAFASARQDGATYGVSWRVSDGTFGSNITTGWVENSTFDHNYIGAYSYGGSGITWKNNRFENNTTYGLNPHNDSNNALITGNTFDHNGLHGLILTKRSDYNIIQGNVSYDNRLHGIVLNDNSSHNLLNGNLSYRNTDNFVIYGSSFNTLSGNQSFSPARSGVRISNASSDNYITNNVLEGGPHGLYIYNSSTNVLATGNWIHGARKALQTQGAINVVFASNEIDGLRYAIAPSDRLIFGPNTINRIDITPPAAVLADNPSRPTLWRSLTSLVKNQNLIPGHF